MDGPEQHAHLVRQWAGPRERCPHLPEAHTHPGAEDAQGRPVAGVTVTFTVTDNNGTLSNSTATTDASGLAETTLTLGNSAGNNAVQASIAAPGTPTSVTFTATGT